ncbi:MAG: DUF881 domain-containing protein [Peptococcaceae bacterium]|jgi:uncharacterized protein YlxW (UPF0749 family)|nr:DUF881 domain-containing protein [Peptococcaceae bacterium]
MTTKKNSALGLITLGMIIIGVLGMVLVKSYQAQYDTNLADASLPNLLQLELENEQLAKENAKLWEELAKLQAGQNEVAFASEKIKEASINAGLVPLTGLGIRIILDDSDFERDSEYGNYVIHEEYLRTLINILWNGGAEAIAVNNQRISAHTEIFCSGAYIQINGTRQMPPYRIVAIGNQDDLQSALQFYLWDILGEYQQQYGITRKLEVPTEPLRVPAAIERNYMYAEPVKEG